MTRNEIDELVSELVNDNVELRHYVTHASEDLTDDEIDELVTEMDSDPLEIRRFVLEVLGEESE